MIQDQIVVGTIGKVSNLHGKLDAIVKQQKTSWVSVAKSMAMTRQAVVAGVKKPRVQQDHLERICKALDIDILSLFEGQNEYNNR